MRCPTRRCPTRQRSPLGSRLTRSPEDAAAERRKEEKGRQKRTKEKGKKELLTDRKDLLGEGANDLFAQFLAVKLSALIVVALLRVSDFERYLIHRLVHVVRPELALVRGVAAAERRLDRRAVAREREVVRGGVEVLAGERARRTPGVAADLVVEASGVRTLEQETCQRSREVAEKERQDVCSLFL